MRTRIITRGAGSRRRDGGGDASPSRRPSRRPEAPKMRRGGRSRSKGFDRPPLCEEARAMPGSEQEDRDDNRDVWRGCTRSRGSSLGHDVRRSTPIRANKLINFLRPKTIQYCQDALFATSSKNFFIPRLFRLSAQNSAALCFSTSRLTRLAKTSLGNSLYSLRVCWSS